MGKNCHIRPPLWDFFIPSGKFQTHSQNGSPSDLAIFSSSYRPCCLVDGLCLGVFSVPGIYVEAYVHDDVYVRVLVVLYFVLLNIESTYYNLKNCILNKTDMNSIRERLDFYNTYVTEFLHV